MASSISLDLIDKDIHSITAHQGGTWTIDAITNAVTVTATNLDIRDLAFATDKVDVSGSSVSITGDVNVTQGTNPWIVSATNLDIRDLAFATDKVDVSGSSVSISGDVNVTQGTDPWIVSATNLDIRDLAFATDKVDVSGSSVSITGDVNVTQGTSPWVVSGTVTAAPEAYDTWKVAAVSVGTSAVQLTATALTNRLSMIFQNNSSNDIALGTTNAVTIASGLLVPKKGSVAVDFGAGAVIWAIASGATSDLHVTELAV
jgi:lipopolysaccharide export system protein LptA